MAHPRFRRFPRGGSDGVRVEIPLRQRADWEVYLAENAAAARRLTATIADAERAIDATVYDLFDLTKEEIALLEASVAGQF